MKSVNKSRIWSTVFFAAALLGMSLGAVAAPPGPVEAGLFSEVAVADGSDEVDDPTVVRSRPVTVNLAQLGALDAAGSAGSVADVLVLNLFDDAVYTAVLDRVETSSLGTFSWVGNLEGVEFSQVILSVKDGVMVGNVVAPGMFYQVRYAGDGVHAIRETDQATFPPEAPPIPVDLPAGDVVQPDGAADDGSIIDVLVVYTDDARAQVGGTTAMEALIATAEAETNAGYANSNVTQRIDVVHTAEVAYDETGMGTEAGWQLALSRLRNTSDGHMDDVHTLRDAYLADEVVLIVQSTTYCGLAYLMSTVSSYFESSAFALVSYYCTTGRYSFAHEMGHNMGAHHDRANANGTGAFSYSYGYQAPDKAFRTVMAYDCSSPGCPRVNHWSNPDISYGGQPTGVISTALNSADNHLTLNDTAYTVANFRSNAPPYEPSNPSPADGAMGQSVDVDLGWIGGDPDSGDTATFDVYFRDSASSYALICDDVAAPPCDPGTLDIDAHYYWYVVATDSYSESTTGPEWDFYTFTNDPPNTPSDPLPPDGATGESVDVDLAWTGGDPDAGDTVTYTVYLDTNDPPSSTVCHGTATTCDPPSSLAPDTPYYWQAVATDSFSETTAGPVWGFTTGTSTGPTIRGYVRDASLAALDGVTVTFNGPLTATTGGSGYYAQSGLVSGTYTITVSADGYTFSPKEDLVTVGDEDVAHYVTGYALAPTGLLFYDGFEDGNLGSAWAVETDYEGRVRVSTLYPAAGNYSLLLDDDTDSGLYSHASAILALDLNGEEEVKLSFWWQAFKFESSLNDNGVFISENDGETWAKVFTFTSSTEFSHAAIDLDEEARNAKLILHDHFLVKFQIYENWSIPVDGCVIDDVLVYNDRYKTYLPLVLDE